MEEKTSRKDRVQFAASPPEIISRHFYSIHDMQECWYSRHEYKYIMIQLLASLQVLRDANVRGGDVDHNEHCPCGLEQMQSKEHCQHIEFRRKAIVQAVLAEQRLQRLVASTAVPPDPEALRNISISISKVSLDAALNRAAQVVTSLNCETTDSCPPGQDKHDGFSTPNANQRPHSSNDWPVNRKRPRIESSDDRSS